MTFSKHEMHQDQEFDHAVRFAVLKREAAVMPMISANPGSHVVTVGDNSDENLEFIRDQIVAGVFGYVPGVHQQYVRDTLRPASRGAGRSRWR